MINLEEIPIADSIPAPVLRVVPRRSVALVAVDSLVEEDVGQHSKRRSPQRNYLIDSSVVDLVEWVVVVSVRVPTH